MNHIIVVGAGTAGMCCAIRAAELGAKVLVIEKDSLVGGTLHVTAGHMSGGGTKRQAEKGIEDSPTLHFEDVMKISKHTADPIIVKLATDLAPKTIDWLQDLGFPFEPDTPKFIYGHVPYKIPRTHWGTTAYEGTEIKWAGSTIFETIKPVWDKLIEEGKIEIHLNTTLENILLENGEVKGIVCKELSGTNEQTTKQTNHQTIKHLNNQTTQQFNSKTVILTTGGYASNHDFFKEVTPDWPKLVSTARHTSTGDGILAAMNIGAKFHNAEKHTATLGGLELEPGSGRTDFWKHWCRVSNAVDRKPREIYINAESKRFMDENESDVDLREKTVEAQTGKKFWVIFDEKALNETEGGCIIPQFTPEKLKAEAANEKAVWTANSIEELAQKIGLDKNILSDTVNTFNSSVQAQNDEEFGRTYLKNEVSEAPFYAILTHCFSLVSFGGLATTPELQVIDENNQPIAGLYAAGEILGGGVTCGNAFVGGMFITPAMSFGRYLGEKLAKLR